MSQEGTISLIGKIRISTRFRGSLPHPFAIPAQAYHRLMGFLPVAIYSGSKGFVIEGIVFRLDDASIATIFVR